ncbi:RmlC-like cupin domain-containing protein [Hysterangium stoloniferum]|nr:RmlC-like cupin domain-containing protein [Hysterangium stoloniferum]
MHAYYFDNLPGDPRLPHDYVPSRPVSEETLQKLGLKHWHIPVEGHEPTIDEVARTHGYKYRDVIDVSKAGLGEAFEANTKAFFDEHMHGHDEIRFILDGSGFSDVRETPTEAWIRLPLSAGDLLVIPAGMYHRFTLDETDAIKAVLLFKFQPKRVAFSRGPETDVSPSRKEYLESIGVSMGA